ncbi:MAG: sugar kinase [Nocardioidaceae bacterium]|nr:sugar kinase [Nocardioidaceae bacterium]
MSERLEVATFGELLVVIAPFHLRAPLEAAALLEKSVGGAEVNVALGLARLGHKVTWVGAVGDDPFGHEGVRVLRGEGIDVSRVVVSPSASTGIYFKELTALDGLRNYPYREASAASRMTYADLDVDHLLSGRVLHLTGITALVSDAGHDLVARLIAEARARGIHVSFDVNLRHRLLRDRDAVTLLAPLARAADTLFLSRSEAALLFSATDPAEVQALFPTLQVQTVVVHHAQGAFAVTPSEVAKVDARAIDVVDPTGAGDAFVAGYLSGWLEHLPLTARLKRAEHCAAHAVVNRGDSPLGVSRPATSSTVTTESDDR